MYHQEKISSLHPQYPFFAVRAFVEARGISPPNQERIFRRTRSLSRPGKRGNQAIATPKAPRHQYQIPIIERANGKPCPGFKTAAVDVVLMGNYLFATVTPRRTGN